MKKATLLSISLALTLNTFSQSDVAGPGIGHQRIPGFYVGWTPGFLSVPGPLDIRNNFSGPGQPINFFTTNIQRVTILGNTNLFGTANSGFVGLNNANPTFNIDGVTRNGLPVVCCPALGGGGHLFLRFRPSNFLTNNPANENEMGLWNFSGNAFAPTFFGHVNSTQTMPGIILLGAIDNAQDVSPATNANPVHQFRVGKNLNINVTTLSNISEVNNRVAYAWYNGSKIKMIMNAAGQVRVGTNLIIPTNLPGNRLEITSDVIDPGLGNVATAGGSSGIRTTNMTALTPTITNPGKGVVAVDSSGNFIYVPSGGGAGGGTTLGNACGSATPNPLPSNWEIPLNGFNFRFAGNAQGTASNNVGIGTSCAPSAKLHVEQSSGSTNGSIGILVRNNDMANCFTTTTTPQPVIGIKSVITNNTNGQNFQCAGWFQATNASNCTGQAAQFALFVPPNSGFITFGYPLPYVPSALLDVNGTTNSSGGYTSISDISLKNTVTTLPNSLSLIKRLRPVTFKWNTTSDTLMSGIHAGFIAQEVDTVIPQVVRTGNSGLKSIAYDELIPYIVSAFQAQQKTIDSLKTQIAALTSSVTSCCSSSAIRSTSPAEQNQLTVNLADEDRIVLNQNTPNPFAEQTTITYIVPEKYGYAQIIFRTIEGKIIKTVDITKKGGGQLKVFAGDLSSGMYSYSLEVDGKIFATKKMVKSE